MIVNKKRSLCLSRMDLSLDYTRIICKDSRTVTSVLVSVTRAKI